MPDKQKVNRFLLVFLFFICLSSPVPAAADVSFVKEYTYQASEVDSKVSSRAIALEQVKRQLLEELGTYLETETEVKNYQLTKDQITVLTAGIVSAEVLQEKWDGLTYYLKARITANPGEVANAVKASRDNKRTALALEESRAKAEEALKEIARLKKELEALKTDGRKQKEYVDAVKGLSAADWYDRGSAFHAEGRQKEALAAYTKAIELNPQYQDAYVARGAVYSWMDSKEEAARDYETGITLLRNLVKAEPDNVNALIRLGNALFDAGQCDQAVSLYGKALLAVPRNPDVRTDMAVCYRNIGMLDTSVAEFRKVLSMNPNHAIARYNLGVVLAYDLGNAAEGVKEWEAYLEIEPKGHLAEAIREQIKALKSSEISAPALDEQPAAQAGQPVDSLPGK
jgi:tetratricopeptide (TPR) repeat protein